MTGWDTAGFSTAGGGETAGAGVGAGVVVAAGALGAAGALAVCAASSLPQALTSRVRAAIVKMDCFIAVLPATRLAPNVIWIGSEWACHTIQHKEAGV